MKKSGNYVLFSVLTVIFILGVHVSMLILVSKGQREIVLLKRDVSSKGKIYLSRNKELDEKIDFKKLRKRAEEDFEMEISDNIEYFRVD